MTIGPRDPLNHEPPFEHYSPSGWQPVIPRGDLPKPPPKPPVKPRPSLMERFRGWLVRVLRA